MKIKEFRDSYDDKINEFIASVKVIDIKYSITWSSEFSSLMSGILVLYEDKEEENKK